MQQFDPNFPGFMEGQITAVTVIDNQGIGVGNHVVDPTKDFQITVDWEVSGLLAPLWLAALGGTWTVSVYAESLGAGPELLLARDDTVSAVPGNTYSTTLNVAAPSGLVEGNPGSNESGIYKLVVSVFLNSNLGAPGFDLVGFFEGPIIQVEDPN